MFIRVNLRLKNILRAFAAAAFDFAWAVDGFVYHRVAFVVDRRRTRDGDVQLICDIELDLRNAFAVDNGARRVQVVRIDVSGAAAIDIDDLRVTGNVDGRRAFRIDRELVVAQAFDIDVTSAFDRKSLELRNGDSEVHRLARRVVLRVSQAQHIIRDFRRHNTENVVVAFNFQTQVFLASDFDIESPFSRD